MRELYIGALDAWGIGFYTEGVKGLGACNYGLSNSPYFKGVRKIYKTPAAEPSPGVKLASLVYSTIAIVTTPNWSKGS